MENFHLINNGNVFFENMDILNLIVFRDEEVSELLQEENTVAVVEQPSSSPNIDVPVPATVPNNSHPVPDQEGPEPLRAKMNTTCEPLPSTSSGLTVATTQTEESSSEETEVASTPTVSTEDILKLRPPIKKSQRKKVPEESKDKEYHDRRRKNVKAARNCRAKKRKIDEERVALLNTYIEENERLQQEVQRLRGIEASHAKLENDIVFLRNVCLNLCAKVNEAGGHVNFPGGGLP